MNYTRPEFSEAYEDLLIDKYPEEIVDDVLYEVKSAPLLEQPGQTIDYIRTKDAETKGRPVFHVPGFTATLVAKGPFAAEMAKEGFDITVPDQNRHGVLRNFEGEKDPTFSQAINNLSVMVEEGLTDQTVDVITHSYGSLIFQDMLKIANALGIDSFKDSNVVMLAPSASSGTAEQAWPFFVRWYTAMFKQDNFIPGEYSDLAGEMMKAATKVSLANPVRVVREVVDLKNKQVNFETLMESGIAKLAVLAFLDDLLFSHDHLEPGMRHALAAGASYAMPISFELQDDAHCVRNISSATHADEQFNPARVVGAIRQILRTEDY